MAVLQEIKKHIAVLAEPKRSEMQELHKLILRIRPKCKLWYFDGTDSKGKMVSNPTIGYGLHSIEYANGISREFFQIGLSANTGGISVHILGIKDKTYLAKTFGKKLGKAKVTGYCIKFRSANDIDLDVLQEAIRYGLKAV